MTTQAKQIIHEIQMETLKKLSRRQISKKERIETANDNLIDFVNHIRK